MDVDNFVQNVNAICKLRGTTPTAACISSGAGKDLISDAKRRGSIPSVARVKKLADYLGTTVSDLLGEKKEPATIPGDGPDSEVLEMLKQIQQLGKMDEVKRYLRFQATPEEKQ